MNERERDEQVAVAVFTTTTAARRLADALEETAGVAVTVVDRADDPAAALTDHAGADCVACGYGPSADDADEIADAAAGRDCPCLVVSEQPYGSLSGDPLAGVAAGFHRVLADDPQPRLAVHRLDRLVAEQARAETLERERAYRETLLEDPDRSMGLIDASGTVEDANERALAFAGLFDADESVIGRPVWETPWIQRSSAGELRVKEVLEKLRAGETVRDEIAARDRNHNLIEVETLTRPVRIDGDVVGAVVSAEDITGRRSQERRLRVVTRVLRHNVRNDLAAILGRVDLLETREALDGEATEHLAAIRSLTGDIVNKSELTRRIQQTLSVDRSPVPTVDLARLLESELDRIAERYPETEIDRSLPESCPARAEAGIDIAFRALLENAVEHNDSETPSITVEFQSMTADGGSETDPSDQEIEVRIADDGPGIPDHELELLEEGTETDLEHTSGLGLWAADWIVRDSGGTFEVTAGEPRGTVATVRLTAATDED